MWDGHEWKIRGVNESNLPNWLYIDRTPGQEMLTIYNVTMSDNSQKYMIMIHLDTRHLNPSVVGTSGFITMGDHNLIEFGSTAYDQNGADGYTPICPRLVSYSMISGVARGELPWFGAIKLYLTGTNTGDIPANTNLWLGLSIVTLVALSFLADYALDNREIIWKRIKELLKR
jgi:signal peptidase